ncbi:MAG TPA: type VI secretion system tip protein VgrG [Candidatus Acidoferrum sp.]|nr:type VI secretion system tip protein VgrG [Candidatus Acidoferrum sp.]
MNAQAQIENGSLVTFTVKSGGKAIPDTFQVYSIHIEQAVNRIGVATVVILDGDPATEDFPASSSEVFVPGAEISIEAGYDNQNALVFAGIVTRQTLRVDEEVGSALEIECRDKAVKMTVGRKSASFANKTDSDVITTLIGNSPGLSSAVTATSAQIPELVQYYCSDWDFMLTRAEVNGMLVTTVNGKVSVFPYDQNATPALTLCYGQDIYGFQAELDAATQLKSVKASAWDFKNQKLVTAQSQASLAGPGNLTTQKLAGVIGLAEFALQTTAAVDSGNLQNWAKAQILKSEYAKIIGTVRSPGSAVAEPGCFITLEGLGGRFNGNHIVSSVHHAIEAGNWVTEYGIGLSPQWFVSEPEVMAPAAAGLVPGVQGLYNATVKQTWSDPDGEFRVLLDLPLFDPTGAGIWARLANFYSSNGFGAFFLPEVGDEVIAGFLNDDPRFPVVLGSVYSSKNKPFSELQPDQKNSHKAIVTKSKLRVVFNDDDTILTAQTPAGNVVVLDDKNKKISLTDQHGNSIVMDSSGIALTSIKNITLSAPQKVQISGDTGITETSSGGDVQVSGMNVKANANVQYSVQGVTVALQGSAEMTLKAAMVMIN